MHFNKYKNLVTDVIIKADNLEFEHIYMLLESMEKF